MEHSSEAQGAPATPTEVVVQRMRELRRARGWSADRLAEELAKHGVSWNRGVVTKLETGRRESVSVAELLGLAATFNVSPMALLPANGAWETARKLYFNLLVDAAASGEPDYGRIPKAVSQGRSIGLLTPEEAEAVMRLWQSAAPKRKANYDAMKEANGDGE